ncbi:hypothetical protein ACSQ67_022251 [Phaseolus vulgaris]
MRTLCDVCESAAAILFCAADEAALCFACDQKTLFVVDVISTSFRITEMNESICVTNLLVDTFGLALLTPLMFHAVTYVKMRLVLRVFISFLQDCAF